MDSSVQSLEDVQVVRDEAFRRLGRNVVLFQELERVLKRLCVLQHVQLKIGDRGDALARRREHVDRQTLGQLIKMLPFSALESADKSAADHRDIHLSVRFNVEIDSTQLTELNHALSELARERNHVIHELLPHWSFTDADSCARLGAYLDEQRQRVIQQIEHFRSLLNSAHEGYRTLKSWIDSPEADAFFAQLAVQSHPIVQRLLAIGPTIARIDGWSDLAHAGALVRQALPEQFVEAKATLGNGSLAALMERAALFEFAHESVRNGHPPRLLFRVRAQSPLEQSQNE